MKVNGRAIAKDILRTVHREIEAFAQPVVVRAVAVKPSAATESYLRIKERRAKDAGMRLEVIRLADGATDADIAAVIARSGADSIIVQLPLPNGLDTDAALDAIPVPLDADVLSRDARERFANGAPDALRPPVVEAIREIFAREDVVVKGKHAVVVGQGWLVGEPVSLWLAEEGAHVRTITREAGDLSTLKEADIIVSGAGVPGLITPDLIKEGVVLIDAGTSESDGSIVGDADPACADHASVFTPVPGGVGPIAVACLFKNAADLAKRGRLQTP